MNKSLLIKIFDGKRQKILIPILTIVIGLIVGGIVMIKENWVRPVTLVQQFVANEYVAACGDSGTTYYFKCDAEKGWGMNLGGDVYTDVNLNGKYDKGVDTYYSSYRSCGETHVAESTDTFFAGIFRADTFIFPFHQDIPVIVWAGENGDNCHCTTNLDKESWETAKS